MVTTIPTDAPQDRGSEQSIEQKAVAGLSQGTLVRRRFFRHTGAMIALVVLVLVIILVIFMMLIFGSAILAGFTVATPDPQALASRGALALLLIPLLLVFFVWLAARFCCSGPIMADQRSYNIISALGESWRMTAASQWKIFGYFFLLGIALFVILMILGAIVGVSMFAGGGMPSTGSFIGIMVGALLLSIPMAYLQVGIPVGIYRALGPTKASDVFA